MWISGSLLRARHAARAAVGRRRPDCADGRGDAPYRRALSADGVNRLLVERAPRLAAHQRAVAEMSGAVARRIGLDGPELHAVIRAAELHDVGKIAVPDAILNKPGSLSDTELEVMRRHAVIGEHILAGCEAAPIGRLVRASHERWDGSGYPDGLVGEDIPLGSRIITICDSYDAMTHARPYRPARSRAEALAELRRGAGVRFDPALVSVFVAEFGYRDARPIR